MRRLTLIVLTLLIAALHPYALSLSEPHLVKPPYNGVPAAISVNSEGLVGIIFYSMPVVGFFKAADGSYYEVRLPGIPSKIVMSGDKAFLISSEPPQLIMVEISTRQVSSKELESRPGDIAVNGGRVLISFPSAGRVVLFDADNLNELENYMLKVADGLNVLTASDAYVWVLDESFSAIHVIANGRVHTVNVESIVYALGSEGGRLWAATVDGKLITLTGWEKQGQVITLPAGTVVDAPLLTARGKVFYASPNRRVIGVVEDSKLFEKTLYTMVPTRPSTGPGGRIWFVDGVSMGLGWVFDSKPPSISEVQASRSAEGPIRVVARVGDPDGDMVSTGVELQVIVYRGVYVSHNESLPMILESDGKYSVTYTPPSGATKIFLEVVASDLVGNRATAQVGEIDLSTPKTTAITTIVSGPGPEVDPTAVLSLALELLLVVPLIVGLTYLALRRRGRRAKPRK